MTDTIFSTETTPHPSGANATCSCSELAVGALRDGRWLVGYGMAGGPAALPVQMPGARDRSAATAPHTSAAAQPTSVWAPTPR
jgi:hypothetical protein